MIELSLMQPTWWNPEFNQNLDYLFFLSWYSHYYNPRRYLDFGVRRGCGAAIVAASCPSVEIYGIDNWADVLDAYMPAREAFVLRRIGHQGYTRFIDGDISTAVQRLQESFVGSFFLDLVFVQGDFLGANLEQQLHHLVPHLSLGGALVLTCTSADRFVSVWDSVQKQFPQFIYVRCQNHTTGMILAISLKNDEHKIVEEENCLFDTKWIGRSRVKCWFLRGKRGLLKPRKYFEYAARIGHGLGLKMRRFKRQ